MEFQVLLQHRTRTTTATFFPSQPVRNDEKGGLSGEAAP